MCKSVTADVVAKGVKSPETYTALMRIVPLALLSMLWGVAP